MAVTVSYILCGAICQSYTTFHRFHHTLIPVTTCPAPCIECEAAPPGMGALTPDSTDEEIDARIRAVGVNHMHAMGRNPMGKVVDINLRVKGVRGLRAYDASVFPVAIGGHPQATLYALAEKAADIILDKA